MLAADTVHRGIVEQLAAVLVEAGEVALRTFGSDLRSWTKGDSSPVTEADIAVNVFLQRRLSALAPDCAWLSEETEDDRTRLSARRVWVVDPIDGTRAYIKKLPDWTISVALVEDGRPAAAALLAPVERKLFLAASGGGTLVNGVRVTAHDGDDLAGLRIAGPKRTLERLARIIPGMDSLPKVHSLALRLARVADGELDAAFAGAASHDWDLAAADLLVHEAGGALTSMDGELPVYNRDQPVHRPLLAAGSGRHQRLIELVRAKMPEFSSR